MTTFPHSGRYSASRHQAGYSLVEFLLAAPVVLLSGLICIEITHWLYIKQAISLALLEAGRAGITANASPTAMEQAFEKALEPLFPSTRQQSSRQRLEAALDRRSRQAHLPAWQIRIVNPSPAVFRDFARSGLSIQAAPHLPAIENAWQAEQDAHYRSSGQNKGKGELSGLTIYEANTLVLHLDFLHAPALPGLAALLKALAGSSTDSYRKQGLAAGYLPLQQEIQLGMQSNPAHWPSLPNQKVVSADFENHVNPLPFAPCTGWWCPNGRGNSVNTGLESSPPETPLTDWLSEAEPPLLPGMPHVPGEPQPLLPTAPEEMCGISVCCAV